MNRIVSIMWLSGVCPVDDLGNELDLDTRTKWNLRPAKRAARMRSTLAKDLQEKFRRAVRNHMRLCEIRCAVHHHQQPHEPFYLVQVPEGGL
jgi:hypothetical protein